MSSFYKNQEDFYLRYLLYPLAIYPFLRIFPKNGRNDTVLPIKSFVLPALLHRIRFALANNIWNRCMFFAIPRYTTFEYPICFFTMRNGCSTLQRTADFSCSIFFPVKTFEIIRHFEAGRTLIYPELNLGFLLIIFSDEICRFCDIMHICRCAGYCMNIPTACINCGRCHRACPFGLIPTALAKAYEAKDAQALSDLQVMQCMECGSCSYICPARRPLSFMNKLGKAIVKEAGIK